MSESEAIKFMRVLIEQIETGEIEDIKIFWKQETRDDPDPAGNYIVASPTGCEVLTISYKRNREAE